MNQIIILTGPSGVGKTVLAEYLIEALGLSRCVTTTSRLPRPGEKDGIDYFFLSSEEFEQIRSVDGFAEYSKHYHAEYGIRRVDLDAVLLKGHVLLVLDCGGTKSMASQYPANTVFIAPPSLSVLEQRLMKRSGHAAERLAFAEAEMAQMNDFDYVLVNKELNVAKKQLLDWVVERLEL